jgi:GTP-binding protein
VPGCPVTIGDVTFDWEPNTPAGVAAMMGRRGTDARVDRNDRISAAVRKAARGERRRHHTDEELFGSADDEDDDPINDGAR